VEGFNFTVDITLRCPVYAKAGICDFENKGNACWPVGALIFVLVCADDQRRHFRTHFSIEEHAHAHAANILEPQADRDVVVVLIQGKSASSSLGVSPGQKAVIVLVMCAALAIGLVVVILRSLLPSSTSSSGPVALGMAASFTTCSIRSVLCPVMTVFLETNSIS
jgi:hypothetical protein